MNQIILAIELLSSREDTLAISASEILRLYKYPINSRIKFLEVGSLRHLNWWRLDQQSDGEPLEPLQSSSSYVSQLIVTFFERDKSVPISEKETFLSNETFVFEYSNRVGDKPSTGITLPASSQCSQQTRSKSHFASPPTHLSCDQGVVLESSVLALGRWGHGLESFNRFFAFPSVALVSVSYLIVWRIYKLKLCSLGL